MAKHNDLGKKGEEEAIAYLIQQGYQILETNWKYKRLEIDIIAYSQGTLCFIEVKTRRDRRFAEPHQALTKAKQKRILVAANHYIRYNQIDSEVRFDLITIIPSETPPLTHYEEVFLPFIF